LVEDHVSERRPFRRLLRVPGSAARQAARDIEEEVSVHLDMRTEELMAEGMSEEEARREAVRAFGDPERAKRDLMAPERRRLRRVRAGEWLSDVARDVRHSARSLLRAPAFTLVAVLTLALGVGATTALFSVIDAVLLEPLPFPEPDELAMVFEAREDRGADDRNVVNPGNYKDWLARARSFETMAAMFATPVTVLSGGQPREVSLHLVHQDFFRTLGVSPRLGRTFTAEEAALPPGEAQVVVLSDRFWRDHMGGDPNVIGRTLELVGSSAQIIGVMPPSVEVVSRDAAFWMPTDYEWGTRGGRFITVVARRADGVSHEAAEREMISIAAALREENPEFNARWSANVVPLTEHLSGDVRLAMLIVLAAVGVLLLIACVNVANLLLARAATRRTEIAVRSSLGAGRARIARGLLVESLVLASVGGVLGVGVAFLATQALVAGVPESLQIARLRDVDIDGSVLLFAAIATIATGLLFGIAPVVEAFRTDLAGSLREGGRGGGAGQRARRTRAVLVVAEVALSLVLLAGAGLLLRSLMELQRTDLGFDPANAVSARVTLRGDRYAEPGSRPAFFAEALQSIGSAPGVEAAGMIWWLPLSGLWSATDYYHPDRPRPAPGEEPGTQVQAVQGDIFEAFGIPLLQGRTFDSRDVAGGAGVVIINRAFAERAWPGENPIGRRLVLPWGEDLALEVVGVVGDMRHKGVDQTGEPSMFLPHAQFQQLVSGHLIVRGVGSTASLQRIVAERVAHIDPTLALADMMPLSDVVSDAVARPRLTSLLVAAFAGLALLLAAVGIYGVVSYAVTLRARELSVRRALGAQTGDVTRMVVLDALRLGGAGVAIGVLIAFLSTRVLESLLYGVKPADPVVFASTAALLLTVTALAALLPAVRASRVSPAEAMRNE
jgi:predicted permease